MLIISGNTRQRVVMPLAEASGGRCLRVARPVVDSALSFATLTALPKNCAMNQASQSTASNLPASSIRWRKELVLAGVGIGVGLLVLPALIYLVGILILGAYGGGPHIGSFYGDFFRNLFDGAGRTWFIALGPFLLLSLIRLIFWPWRPKLPANQQGPSGDLAQPTPPRERREPFVAP